MRRRGVRAALDKEQEMDDRSLSATMTQVQEPRSIVEHVGELNRAATRILVQTRVADALEGHMEKFGFGELDLTRKEDRAWVARFVADEVVGLLRELDERKNHEGDNT